MAYVIHTIRDNSGKGEEKYYLYNHYRYGNIVVSKYISPISIEEYRLLKQSENIKREQLKLSGISYTTRPRIYTTGYPVHNPDGSISESWRKGHQYANKKQREKYPRETKEINKLSRTFPKDELMGKHTKSGKIIISERVPKHLREAISYHEKVEHEYMEK